MQHSASNLPVVANRIACTGHERQLVECPGRYGEHIVDDECSHDQDVGLRCVGLAIMLVKMTVHDSLEASMSACLL